MTKSIRLAIKDRLRLSRRDSLPIRIVPGRREPYVAGQSCGWETRGGQPIYHPSAYARVGWSSMVYVHSTRRIEVGAARLGVMI